MSLRLLLWEPEPRARLRTVAALRGLVDLVLADDPGENPVRLVRRLRPDLMLLALGRGRLSPGLQTCRVIKTGQGLPPRVGLTDRWSRLREPDQALSVCDGDGYLGGVPDAAALRRFVEGLMAGQRPVHLHPPEPGLLGRLLTRGRRT